MGPYESRLQPRATMAGQPRRGLAALALLVVSGIALAVTAAYAAPHLTYAIPPGFTEQRTRVKSWLDATRGWTIRTGETPVLPGTSVDALYAADLEANRAQGEIRVVRVPGAVGAYLLIRRTPRSPLVFRVFTGERSHEFLFFSSAPDSAAFRGMVDRFVSSARVAP